MVDHQLSILGNVNSGTYAKELFIFLHGLPQVVLFLYYFPNLAANPQNNSRE